MARSKSSRDWLKEHFSDQHVQQAQQLGYRSRAAFKLIAIQEKYHFIRPGMRVLDIGAAPGSWTQLACQWVGDHGCVVAVDKLPMEPLARAQCIQGDVTEPAVWEQVLQALAHQPVDCVIADMAPNMSGIKVADQARAMYLVEWVVDFALDILGPKGVLLTKVFQGAGFDTLLKQVRQQYDKVQVVKPPASRARSSELYWLATTALS